MISKKLKKIHAAFAKNKVGRNFIVFFLLVVLIFFMIEIVPMYIKNPNLSIMEGVIALKIKLPKIILIGIAAAACAVIPAKKENENN